MKSLGISVKETGVIYSVCAVLGVFIPICVGIVADKLGNFKVAHITIDKFYKSLLSLIIIIKILKTLSGAFERVVCVR